MKIALYIISALVAYFVTGLNPAIIISKLVYHKDIRTCGSGNPGFTNFKRTFGGVWAWVVMAIDLLKSAVVVGTFALLFKHYTGHFQLGAAYTGLFCMLGHSFPIWYKFKGGKGFLVYMSLILFVDWRAWLVACAVLAALIFTIKYMSLSTMCAVTSSVVVLFFTDAHPGAIISCTAMVLFIIIRHHENINRLIHGTERKFYFSSKKKS